MSNGGAEQKEYKVGWSMCFQVREKKEKKKKKDKRRIIERLQRCLGISGER